MCTWGTIPLLAPIRPISGACCSLAPLLRCILFTHPAWCINCLLQASNRAMAGGAVDTEFRIPFPIASAQDTRLAIAVDKYGYLVSSTPHS